MNNSVHKFLGVAERADRAVIWLHGLGANGHDFADVLPYLGLAPELNVHFVFPHAPSIPVSINAGTPMPAWYDLLELPAGVRIDSSSRIDFGGLYASAERIGGIVQELQNAPNWHGGGGGIPPERIVLGGFSQGAVVSLRSGLLAPYQLGGIFGLSGYLPLRESEKAESRRDVPIFLGHGTFDAVVDYSNLAATESTLDQLEIAHESHSYPIQHSVSPQEFTDLGRFIQRCWLDGDRANHA